MSSYLPLSGVFGSALIGSLEFSFESWAWNGAANIIPAPSFTGRKYMEYCVGKSSLSVVLAGTFDANQNAFVTANMRLGFSVPVTLFVNNSTYAQASDCLIASMNISDESDGKCDYVYTLIGNWLFTDFSGTPA